MRDIRGDCSKRSKLMRQLEESVGWVNEKDVEGIECGVAPSEEEIPVKKADKRIVVTKQDDELIKKYGGEGMERAQGKMWLCGQQLKDDGVLKG